MIVALIALILAGCAAPPEEAPEPRGVEQALAPLPPSTHPAVARLVAIGDVHGDLDALRSALRRAGAIDERDRWSGGSLWVVQTGDLLDRGDDEDEILRMVARLEREARADGGRLLALNGNHEIMNVQGDFRYVTPDGFADFASFASRAPSAARARLPREMHGRAGAFAPGGRYARELAARSTVVVVGDTVHGGLTSRHLERGLDTINRDVRRFLLGQAPLSPLHSAEDSPHWHRDFALRDDPATCSALGEVLRRLRARRMVVGHTVQAEGINAACDERVWRIDVGLARHYGGPNEVLEIAGETVRVLR